jgi:transcriptional antiterminator
MCYNQDMLNERQKNIILILENSPVPLTAQKLADDLHVSLRTIRNDIVEVSKFVEEHHGSFIRKPHIGMTIESPYSLSLYFDNQYKNQNFFKLNEQERSFFLLMQFLMKDNPLTVQNLQQTFQVSRSTIQASIKKFNHDLSSYSIALKGYKKKGYYLKGKLSDVIRLICTFADIRTDRVLSDILFDKDNALVFDDWKEKIETFVQYLTDNLFLFVSNYHRLTVLLLITIRWAQKRPSTTKKLTLVNRKVQKCIDWLEFSFHIHIDEECLKSIVQILHLCTDYSDTEGNVDDTYLDQIVQKLISMVKEKRVINDEDTLHIDLIKHLKASLDGQALGYTNKNPLLKTIKELYNEDFILISDCVNRLDRSFRSKMNEDEIGYLTLYFKRSFEKAQSIQETRVMVVCNSGRSASKLLSTRLLNNLPNLHIVAMSSLFDLQSNSKNLENIDLIVSTIPLPGVTKPYIVVSPFLQKNEIDKVKEMIWLNSTKHYNTSSTNDTEEINDTILHQNQLMFESFLAEKAMQQSVIGEQYADIVVDLFDLIRHLYPMGINLSKYNNVAGIFVHVLMSISRWKKKDFIYATDYEDLLTENAKQNESILHFLDVVGGKLGVYIPPVEAVAILRYYVF